MAFEKNQPRKIGFDMLDTSNAPATGKTVTATRSIDGAAFAAAAGIVTEIGSGAYQIAATAADLNGESIAFRFTASGCNDTRLYINPEVDYTAARAANLDAAISSVVTAVGAVPLLVWNTLLSTTFTAASLGAKLKAWVLGSDNKALLSTDAQTGVTIPTVTSLTNAPTDSTGVGTLLSRIGAALTITGGKVDVNDKTGFSLATAPPTASAIATAVWGAVTRTLTGFGFTTGLATDTAQVAAQDSLNTLTTNLASLQDLLASDSTTIAEIRTLVGSWRRPVPATAFPGSETVIYGSGTGDTAGEGEISMTVEYGSDKQPLSKTEV